MHASGTRCIPSTRQDSDCRHPTQDHRKRRWRDHEQRDPRIYDGNLLEPEDARADAVNEHECEEAVGGPGSKQVEQHRDGRIVSDRKASIRRRKLSPSMNASTYGVGLLTAWK